MKKILIFVLMFCSNFYLNAQISAKDQKTIDGLVYKLNKEMVLDSEELPKSTSKKVIDSILITEYKGGDYKSGTVNYSLDKKFKIFIIEGESCGMNCKPMFEGYIYYNLNKKKPTVVHNSMYPIEKIEKIGDNYLIFQRATTGGGNIFYDNRQVTVFKIMNEKLIFTKLNNKKEDDLEDDLQKGNFEINQLSFFEEFPEFYLRYNKKTKSIEYQYSILDENYENPKLKSGSFKI